MNLGNTYIKSVVRQLKFIGLAAAILGASIHASSQPTQTKPDQIIEILNGLIPNKKLIYGASELGEHPIVLMDSGEATGLYLEPEQSRFRPRALSKFEFDHAMGVLPPDSTYALETFAPTGEPLLIIQVCEKCLAQKYSQLSDYLKKTYLSPQGIAAIAFHEHLHAYEQKKWKDSNDGDLNVMRQEGTAFFAESKVLGLLWGGPQKKYSFAFRHLKSVQDYFKKDGQTLKYYVTPALNLLKSEYSSGRDSIVQISESPKSINLADTSVLNLKSIEK